MALVALRYASRSLEAQSRMDLLRILSGVFGLVFAAAACLGIFAGPLYFPATFPSWCDDGAYGCVG